MLSNQDTNRQNQQQSPQDINELPKSEKVVDSPLHVFDKSYEQSITLEVNNFQIQKVDQKNIQNIEKEKPALKLLNVDQNSPALADIMNGQLQNQSKFIIVEQRYVDDELYQESEIVSVNTDEEQWYSHKFKDIQYKKKVFNRHQAKSLITYQNPYQYLQNEDFSQSHYKLSNLALNFVDSVTLIKFYEQNIVDQTKNLILTIATNSKHRLKFEQLFVLPKNENLLSIQVLQDDEKTLIGMICDSDKVCKNDVILYDQNGKKSGSVNLIIKQVAGAVIQTFQTLNQIDDEEERLKKVVNNVKESISNSQKQQQKGMQSSNQNNFKSSTENLKDSSRQFQQFQESLEPAHKTINNSTIQLDKIPDDFPKLDEKTLHLLEQQDAQYSASKLLSRKVKNLPKNYLSSDSNQEKSDDEQKQEDISYLIKSTQQQISAYRYPFSPQPVTQEQRKVNLFSFDFIRKPINTIISDQKLKSINLSMCLEKINNITSQKLEKQHINETQKLDYGMNTHQSQKESRNFREKYSYSESQKFKYSNRQAPKSIVQTVPQNLQETKRNRKRKLFDRLDQSSSKFDIEQKVNSSNQNRQNVNSTAIFCDQAIQRPSKYQKSQKQFDLMLKNININLHKKIYGRKYARVCINETVYQGQSLNGSNLLWSDKGYIFKRIRMKDILHLDLFNEKSEASENVGKVSIQVRQLLLANKESYFQTFLINDRQIAAVALLGFQIIKKSYSLPSKVTKFSKVEDSRYVHNNSESLSRNKYQRRMSTNNGTQIQHSSNFLPAINKSNVYEDEFYGKKIESRVNPIRIRKFIGGKNIKIPKASRFVEKVGGKQIPGPGQYEIQSSFSRHTLKQL